jgi:hypothetical protein
MDLYANQYLKNDVLSFERILCVDTITVSVSILIKYVKKNYKKMKIFFKIESILSCSIFVDYTEIVISKSNVILNTYVISRTQNWDKNFADF